MNYVEIEVLQRMPRKTRGSLEIVMKLYILTNWKNIEVENFWTYKAYHLSQEYILNLNKQLTKARLNRMSPIRGKPRTDTFTGGFYQAFTELSIVSFKLFYKLEMEETNAHFMKEDTDTKSR